VSIFRTLVSFCLFIFSPQAFSNEAVGTLGLTSSLMGIAAVSVFVVAYLAVMTEEINQLRKPVPVMIAAGIIWLLIALTFYQQGYDEAVLRTVVNDNLHEYAALFFFLLVAMTYVNAMDERNVFEALKVWVIKKGFSYRQLFWITGIFSFFMSPVADNLTTALLMGSIVMSVGSGNRKFVSLACINVVIAANAGGAFSPFGDVTTLMVWQAGKVPFFDFFPLFIPCVVNYLIPAVYMSFFIPQGKPNTDIEEKPLKRGALVVCVLFLCTIVTAVSFEQLLHIPPFLGMMVGLSYLFIFSYYIRNRYPVCPLGFGQDTVFINLSHADWDTLLFFFGVIFCVGGLGFIGYLELTSVLMYENLGATNSNILLGIISAVIDNIPVMFAILAMNPAMELYQWLLITLTAGVGGSLLSIGSAAGIALMGQSKGIYTFTDHLKWSWLILLGYAGSIYAHTLING